MGTTFLKRQKEMKRLEKQREKAERRAQKKLAGRAGNEISSDSMDSPAGSESPVVGDAPAPEPEPQN